MRKIFCGLAIAALILPAAVGFAAEPTGSSLKVSEIMDELKAGRAANRDWFREASEKCSQESDPASCQGRAEQELARRRCDLYTRMDQHFLALTGKDQKSAAPYCEAAANPS